jgi:phosphopantetheinyl transferase (holo-ACP synthase)
MPVLPPVGNDIVDLTAPGNLGKGRDGRLCNRVLTLEERVLIDRTGRPDTLLWALWAAKEAAYKAISRDDPAVCSIPRQYRVFLGARQAVGTAASLAGKVITPRGELALRVELTADWVHALAAGSETALDRICRCVEGLEGGIDPSAFVRVGLLREIARFLDCATGDLSVVKDTVGPGAPGLLLRGRLLAVEVSLSHDGRFAAFAFDPTDLISTERERNPQAPLCGQRASLHQMKRKVLGIASTASADAGAGGKIVYPAAAG